MKYLGPTPSNAEDVVPKSYVDGISGGAGATGPAGPAGADGAVSVFSGGSNVYGPQGPVARAVNGTTLYTDAHETSQIWGTSAAPSGDKVQIVAEVINKPGVLHEIWMAMVDAGTTTGFSERGGRIKIFVNHYTTPVVDLCFSDFFMYGPRGGQFNTPWFSRIVRDGGSSGAFRRLNIPFSSYLRVEAWNTTTADSGSFYASASYTTGLVQRGNYRAVGVEVSAASQYQDITICDQAGSGTLESVYLSGLSTTDNDYAWLEGNILIYVDGSTTPAVTSSGAEDFFNGAWYQVPVGGFPTGRSGLHDLGTGSAWAAWKFFKDMPLRYNSNIKIVYRVGQQGQASMSAATYRIHGWAGLVEDTSNSGTFKDIGTGIVNDTFSYSAGALSGSYSQPGDRAAATWTGSALQFPSGNSSTYNDMRVQRTGLSLPTDYWVQGRFRITTNQAYDQEVGLFARADGDGYFGGGVHIQVVRSSQYVWWVRSRDDFDTVSSETFAFGTDMTNVDFDLAIKVEGSKITTYWKFADAADHWKSLATWTTGKTGTSVGMYAWNAGALVDSFDIYNLQTRTATSVPDGDPSVRVFVQELDPETTNPDIVGAAVWYQTDGSGQIIATKYRTT